MFLQQHDRIRMVCCQPSNITWSSQQCKLGAKENCTAYFLRSQIQAQQASTQLLVSQVHRVISGQKRLLKALTDISNWYWQNFLQLPNPFQTWFLQWLPQESPAPHTRPQQLCYQKWHVKYNRAIQRNCAV